jgi:hypothetical protein
MNPTLIGYFPKRTVKGGSHQAIPDWVQEVCNVADGSPEPNDWINLWLHNEMWAYNTEILAWAVGIDRANLGRVRKQAEALPGCDWQTISAAIQQYIDLHVPVPWQTTAIAEPSSEWQVFAYRIFPHRYSNGKQEPFEAASREVQPLPDGYHRLGYDVVSREMGNEFCHSPLSPFCNGMCWQVPVNCHCLLDDPRVAAQWAEAWSNGRYDENGSYIGPAEPGPYFIVEVLRRV